MNDFVSFGLIFCLFTICSAQKCERRTGNYGEIYGSISSRSGETRCWTIEVPENSYVRLNVTSLEFQNWPCSNVNLEIFDIGANETYTYCDHDKSRKPITALSDVNIIYYHKDYYSSYRTSFNVSYAIEDLICAQKDHFRCSKTSCVHQYQRCNGVKDCENGADEIGCEPSIAAVKGMSTSRANTVTWLTNQRSTWFGWGKNTHRAITALHLAKAVSFKSGDLTEELMVKQLELQASVALLRSSHDPISVSELSMFVNALTVTCHNPRQFYGYDLLQILGDRVSVVDPPSLNAYLTLCNSKWTFTESDAERVMKPLSQNSTYPFISDVQAVAIMAITCMKNGFRNFRNISYPTSIYDRTIKNFIAGQLPDGSFGNVYTTALVTQALIASGQEENKQWNVTATAHYLMQQLNSPSIDFLSAYYTLPVFSGSSLLDIATVNCSNVTRKQREDPEISDVVNKLGGKMRVQYSLYVGDKKDVIHTMSLRMPENSTAYDVMKIAQMTDPKFKFLHRDVAGEMYVYDIAGITNDPEAGKYWLLCADDNGTATHYPESPDKFTLEDNQHLIMWYKTADI